MANIKGAPTVTSTVDAPVSCPPHWGPERASRVPSASLAGSGRARFPAEAYLAALPLLFTPWPLHATSTADRLCRTTACKQLAKAALQQIQETIQSVKGEGKAILKEKLFPSTAG